MSNSLLEEYRAGRLTRPELREVLGLVNLGELESFFRRRGVADDSSVDEFDSQVQDLNDHSAAGDLVARFRTFAAAHTLGGLDVKDLISEGRR